MTRCQHDPRIYLRAPIGMYHCPGSDAGPCGCMVIAGLEHGPCEDGCPMQDPATGSGQADRAVWEAAYKLSDPRD